MIHHLVLMISSLSATQLDQLATALKQLGDKEANPLAKPVMQLSEEGNVASVVNEASVLLDANEAAHERLWGAIERLEKKHERLELNREAF